MKARKGSRDRLLGKESRSRRENLLTFNFTKIKINSKKEYYRKLLLTHRIKCEKNFGSYKRSHWKIPRVTLINNNESFEKDIIANKFNKYFVGIGLKLAQKTSKTNFNDYLKYIDPKLSQMQAGFRKNRGCRDNVATKLMLVLAINKILEEAEIHVKSLDIITYIDFVASFDSVYHSYLLESLKKFDVPLKYCRIIKAIYQ